MEAVEGWECPLGIVATSREGMEGGRERVGFCKEMKS